MIEIHADDFGMFPGASRMIIDCINNGCVNGISIMSDSSHFEECMSILEKECKKEVLMSVHLDLITGKALSGRSILTDDKGFFNVSYLKYILISLVPFYRNKYRKAIKKELSMQIDACIPYFEGNEISIDSHRHIHMLPLVFSVIMELISEKKLSLSHMRLTMDAPYVFRGLRGYEFFRPLNIIKCLLLYAFGTIDKLRYRRRLKGKTRDFAGILLSGSLTEKNLLHVLRNIKESGAYMKRDIEIMIHPYVVRDRSELDEINDDEDRVYVTVPMRQKEMRAVKSPEVCAFLRSYG